MNAIAHLQVEAYKNTSSRQAAEQPSTQVHPSRQARMEAPARQTATQKLKDPSLHGKQGGEGAGRTTSRTSRAVRRHPCLATTYRLAVPHPSKRAVWRRVLDNHVMAAFSSPEGR